MFNINDSFEEPKVSEDARLAQIGANFIDEAQKKSQGYLPGIVDVSGFGNPAKAFDPMVDNAGPDAPDVDPYPEGRYSVIQLDFNWVIWDQKEQEPINFYSHMRWIADILNEHGLDR